MSYDADEDELQKLLGCGKKDAAQPNKTKKAKKSIKDTIKKLKKIQKKIPKKASLWKVASISTK